MKRVIIFTVLIIALAGVGFTQSIEQKIIGTWVNNRNGATWEFKTDGTLIMETGTVKTEYKYGVTDRYLALHKQGDRETGIFEISMSINGKTLILFVAEGAGYWLTRK